MIIKNQLTLGKKNRLSLLKDFFDFLKRHATITTHIQLIFLNEAIFVPKPLW